jgi:hypothetical protein
MRVSLSSLAITSTARRVRPGSQRGSDLRPIGAFAALHLLELRHHLAAGLGDVSLDGLALRHRGAIATLNGGVARV